LWSVSIDSAVRHFVSPNEDLGRFEKLRDHLAVLWGGGDHCDVVACNDCDFVYSFPYVGGDKTFYNLAYVRSGYPSWKWEFDCALKLIKDSGLDQPRVLEIGAGDGAFIKALMREVTSNDNLVAIEYSDIGKEQIEKLGVSCLSEDIRSLNKAEYASKFDVICMFQVLEHMDHLHELMETIKSMLKEGGRVIIAVPNENRIRFNELNDALLDMPPNHIGRWTKKAFTALSRRHNFHIRQHVYEPFNFMASFQQMVTYRFLRRSQVDSSIENIVRYRINNRYIRKMALFTILALYSLSLLPKVKSLIANRKSLGGSQLVYLQSSMKYQ